MKRRDNKGLVTCFKCGYEWQKRQNIDPKACPRCKSMNYKKPEEVRDEN